MSKLILIMGDLAVGKSTYANILAKKFNILCVNKDNIKEILGDNFGFINREENLRLSKCSFDLMLYILNKTIIADNNLILESNFREKELILIEKICFEYNVPILILNITGDIKVLHQRFMNRILNENRHIVHQSVDFSNIDVFENMILNCRINKKIGEIIEIKDDAFKYQIDEKYFIKIKNFINNKENNF